MYPATNNKRRHQRYSVNPSVLKSQEFTLVDLSESGAQLSSGHKYSAGKKLTLLFKLDDDEFEITGEIRWCRESHSIFKTGFGVGVQFINHSIATEILIKKYIEKQSNASLV